MMKWEKMGQIFDFNKIETKDFMQNYAQNPNAIELDDRLRIFFTSRPKQNSDGTFVSVTVFADFEKKEPFKLIKTCEKPVLELGSFGDFDEFGIMPGSIVRNEETNELYLYYVGWTRMVSVPYKWAIGLAISKDNGISFKKYSIGPILGAEKNDPYLQACPRVYKITPGNWIMYYNAGTGWNNVDGHMESVYITKMAKSTDGINWTRYDEQVIPSIVPFECQTSPCILKIDDVYHMYYSYRHGVDFRNRNNGYRIGHSISYDMVNWERKDEEAGIDISENGWDSEMVCYPGLFTLNGEHFMLYCGNYFGKHGFGYAKLK